MTSTAPTEHTVEGPGKLWLNRGMGGIGTASSDPLLANHCAFGELPPAP